MFDLMKKANSDISHLPMEQYETQESIPAAFDWELQIEW